MGMAVKRSSWQVTWTRWVIKAKKGGRAHPSVEDAASVIVDSVPIAHGRPYWFEPHREFEGFPLLHTGVLVNLDWAPCHVPIDLEEALPARLAGGVIRTPAVHPDMLVDNGFVQRFEWWGVHWVSLAAPPVGVV